MNSKYNKKERGITLIALIVTIIILLILAGVAISISVNGGDIFEKTTNARESWNTAVVSENTAIKEVWDILNGIDTTPTSAENLISKELTTNGGNGYIGYYADFDGVDGVDGIIYADLLVKKPTSGQWTDGDGAYTIPTNVTAENVKDYVISETAVTDSRFEKAGADPSTYTARYVVKLATNQPQGATEARFYVMGLDDIIGGIDNYFYWYFSASDGTTNYNNSNPGLSKAFGTGKLNTDKMLTKWDPAGNETTEGIYGSRNNFDVWKQVKIKREEYAGWYLPSAGEWGAFANAFNISTISTDLAYYKNYGLEWGYWTSSDENADTADYADFKEGCVGGEYKSCNRFVRLGATF